MKAVCIPARLVAMSLMTVVSGLGPMPTPINVKPSASAAAILAAR